jgi:hypothetical protein
MFSDIEVYAYHFPHIYSEEVSTRLQVNAKTSAADRNTVTEKWKHYEIKRFNMFVHCIILLGRLYISKR